MGAEFQTPPPFPDESSACRSSKKTRPRKACLERANKSSKASPPTVPAVETRRPTGAGRTWPALWERARRLALPQGGRGWEEGGRSWVGRDAPSRPALAQVPPAHLDRGAFRGNPPACRVALHRAFPRWAGLVANFCFATSRIWPCLASGVGWSLVLVDEENGRREGEGGKCGNHNLQKDSELRWGRVRVCLCGVTSCKFFM